MKELLDVVLHKRWCSGYLSIGGRPATWWHSNAIMPNSISRNLRKGVKNQSAMQEAFNSIPTSQLRLALILKPSIL